VNKPNALESVRPHSGQYSPSTDWKLHSWLVVAAVLAVASDYLLRHHPDWSLSIRVILALCPLAPCLLYVRSWVRFVRGMDELQRRIQIESRLAACLGTLLVVTAINALNIYGIPLPVFPRGLNVMGTLILAGIFWRVASAVINRRYR
jgi:hypothetical protein